MFLEKKFGIDYISVSASILFIIILKQKKEDMFFADSILNRSVVHLGSQPVKKEGVVKKKIGELLIKFLVQFLSLIFFSFFKITKDLCLSFDHVPLKEPDLSSFL
jgi:hypothetical protein